MREVIQCLIDWLGNNPSDDKPHLVLRVLAKESIKVASYTDEEMRRFTASDLVAAAQETPAESNNKWIDWRRSIQPYWENREPQIIKFAKKQGLECYPKPKRISTKGGRGKETTYLITAVPLPKISDGEEEQNSERVPIPAQDKSRTYIHYEIAENGEIKPAWGAKWLFHNGQIQLSSRHISVIISCLCLLWLGAIGLSYISWVTLSAPKPITTRELIMLLSIFVIPYATWIFAIKPWGRLFEDRIVRAPELLVDVKEKPSQLELFRDGDLRLIRLVRYSAPCPVCGATIYLDEGSPDFPRRMVGRCWDSPREHIFSFDRVTRKGSVLRSPIG